MEGKPYLKEGMQSREVAKVKEILASQGYWTSTCGIRFGPALTSAVVYFQQTHINKNGDPCSVDGEVGPETWWALLHPSGNSQRNNIVGSIPNGLSDKRESLLKIALSQHGIVEKPVGSNRGPKIDKFLPSWCLTIPGPAWCCFYFSWVCKEAFGEYVIGRREGSCTRAYKLAEKKGIWVPNSSKSVAVPGDAFVMLWKKNGKSRGHIGFILRSSEDGKTFNTVEGNCANRCKVGIRTIDKMAGFIDVCGDRGSVIKSNYECGIIDASDVTNSATR